MPPVPAGMPRLQGQAGMVRNGPGPMGTPWMKKVAATITIHRHIHHSCRRLHVAVIFLGRFPATFILPSSFSSDSRHQPCSCHLPCHHIHVFLFCSPPCQCPLPSASRLSASGFLHCGRPCGLPRPSWLPAAHAAAAQRGRLGETSKRMLWASISAITTTRWISCGRLHLLVCGWVASSAQRTGT